MNIRDATFWKELETIFLKSEKFHNTDKHPQSTKFCDYDVLQDRIQHAISLARRNKTLVLLLQIQLVDTTAGGSSMVDDRLTQLTCNRIGSCLRASDSVCWMTNGKIAVLLEDIKEPSDIPMIVEKMYVTLNNSSGNIVNPTSIRLHAGAGLYPNDASDKEQLWHQAEQALEHAVSTKSDTLGFFSRVTELAVVERLEITRKLYEAYRKNEFRIDYQPVYGVADNQIKAIEALIRWQHPERGRLYPNAFLDLLEESGLSVPVGEQILKNACLFVRSLMDQGQAPLRVCINVFARQLNDPGLLIAILDALYDADIEPGLLQLEFTEEVLTKNIDRARTILTEIKNCGVSVAVDGYGAGKSSMTELLKLPLSLIKLAPSLVNGLNHDTTSQAILSSTLALANSVGMGVAAVGIEDNMQLNILSKLDCLEVQGHFLSQPLQGEELSTMLSAGASG